jgi:hypothetical protein
MAYVVQKRTNGPYLSSSLCVRITCIVMATEWEEAFFLTNSSQSSVAMIHIGEEDGIRGGRP